MRPLVETIIIIGVVVFAGMHDYGIAFVVMLSAVVAFYKTWASRLKPEIMMSLAGLPNHLGYWLLFGMPLGFATRTVALAAILVPIYVLCP